ncbi:MAG: type III-B CRISPR module RAMP protein Cmr4 [Thermotoga sp.]|nr:MAG: type III-B CRISPR module RAMP protein Cmr4 [Thermotoga sp.]
MYKIAKPFFMIVETPLHAGSGTELGIVDMPIQRERHTTFPKIEASGLKGCIREAFEGLKTRDDKINSNEALSLAFGPEEGNLHAGALGFTDARLLLFPVKSMKGVFAWITCPEVLERFKLDLELSRIKINDPIPQQSTAPTNCQLFIKDNKIVLEEYTFEVNKDSDEDGACSKFAKWLSDHVIPKEEYDYWREKIKKDVIVLPDEDFRDFVNLSTEVITRTKIDNKTGTVQPGALFTEEYLPAETILYSLALATPIFNKDKGIFDPRKTGKSEEESVMEFFISGLPEVIQIGGNATIGKGIVRTKIWVDRDE